MSGRPSLHSALRRAWARHLEWTGQRLDRKIARLDRRAGECYAMASKHREKLYPPIHPTVKHGAGRVVEVKDRPPMVIAEDE